MDRVVAFLANCLAIARLLADALDLAADLRRGRAEADAHGGSDRARPDLEVEAPVAERPAAVGPRPEVGGRPAAVPPDPELRG